MQSCRGEGTVGLPHCGEAPGQFRGCPVTQDTGSWLALVSYTGSEEELAAPAAESPAIIYCTEIHTILFRLFIESGKKHKPFT